MYLQGSIFLNMEDVLHLLTKSIDKKEPCSMVRLGDAHNLILAQEKIISINELLNLDYVKRYSERKDTGIEFPNLEARDMMLGSIKKTTILGIFPYNDDRIVSPDWMKRPLTDKVLSVYNIKPKKLCDVCINREMPPLKEFWNVMKNKRVLIISAAAISFAKLLKTEVFKPYNLRVTGTLPLTDFKEIPAVLKQVSNYRFDCILLAAGINANIIGPELAQRYSTTVINFGSCIRFMLAGKTGPGKTPFYHCKPKNKSYVFFK